LVARDVASLLVLKQHSPLYRSIKPPQTFPSLLSLCFDFCRKFDPALCSCVGRLVFQNEEGGNLTEEDRDREDRLMNRPLPLEGYTVEDLVEKPGSPEGRFQYPLRTERSMLSWELELLRQLKKEE